MWLTVGATHLSNPPAEFCSLLTLLPVGSVAWLEIETTSAICARVNVPGASKRSTELGRGPVGLAPCALSGLLRWEVAPAGWRGAIIRNVLPPSSVESSWTCWEQFDLNPRHLPAEYSSQPLRSFEKSAFVIAPIGQRPCGRPDEVNPILSTRSFTSPFCPMEALIT